MVSVAQPKALWKMFESLLILFVSGVLLLFMLLPTTPTHSSESSAAYSKYINSPSEETRREYEDSIRRANRPIRVAQSISGISGIAVLFLLLRVWGRTGGSSGADLTASTRPRSPAV